MRPGAGKVQFTNSVAGSAPHSATPLGPVAEVILTFGSLKLIGTFVGAVSELLRMVALQVAVCVAGL